MLLDQMSSKPQSAKPAHIHLYLLLSLSLWLVLAVAVSASARDVPFHSDGLDGRRFDRSVAAQAVDSACGFMFHQEADRASGSCAIRGFERREIAPGVAHYRWEIVVGPGPFDRIGLNRVVAEVAPFQPARNLDGVFFAHGILFDFRSTFMYRTLESSSDGKTSSRNLPVLLAEEGLDVWGIDFRFTLVPLETADSSFMAGWDLVQDLHDLDLALFAARVTRWATGSDLRPLQLAGFSRGGSIGFALLNAESQRPWWLRQVRSFVALDTLFVAPDEATRDRQCAAAQRARDRIAAGTFGDDFRFLETIGRLAIGQPEGSSPLPPFAGLTNRQASLIVGAGPSSTGFHFVAGRFSTDGLPTGFRFSPEVPWNRLLLDVSPYQPLAGTLDVLEVGCDSENSPFADRLRQVTVPTLYVGAGGGNGSAGLATLERLGSADTESLVVSLLAPEERPFDLGHLELFHADEAETLFWRRIADWLHAH